MVSISLIRQSNNQINELLVPRVAVFVGGTSGIGKITLAEVARVGIGFKAYVIGRKESEHPFKAFIEELHQIQPDTNVIWVEGEVSLLSEVKRICDHIKTLESQIDLLFMTTGYAPFGGRQSLDVSHALSFYSRICFVENLLPLLRASGRRARVISVHSGGLESERRLDVDDLNLERPGAFGPIATQMHMGIMGTLTLERLAEMKENHPVVFIHSHPGIVRTGNLFRGWREGSWGAWMAANLFDPLLALFAYSLQESADRHLYLVTSGGFGGMGSTPLPGVVVRTTRGECTGGLFLVNRKGDTVMNEMELAKLRVRAQETVWVKTHQIIGPYII